MFYRPDAGHGLPHNPLNAVVAPRPIGWISTRGPQGDNLAPFSYFNAIASDPPQVMFSSGAGKDTPRNAGASSVFAVNIVAFAARHAMNATSAALPPGTDEFAHAGISRAECTTIDCPRVADAPATLECRVSHLLPIPGNNLVVIGLVLGVHLRDDCLTDGRFDLGRADTLGRLGYYDYAPIREMFEMRRPR